MSRKSPPELFALVLAGGQSRRMGQDKGSIIYPVLSPLEQRFRLVQLLHGLGLRAFLSCRKDQRTPELNGLSLILDQEPFFGGPGVGILSAHMEFPRVAWLVIACDFPFVDEKTIQDLVHSRQAEGVSTAYRHPDQTIEPLLAIWEPETLVRFAELFKTGQKSPRHALEQTQVQTFVPSSVKALVNINAPEDALAFSELQKL